MAPPARTRSPALVNTGADFRAKDPGWIKLKGMGEMLVSKGIISREESDELNRLYIQACENNGIISVGTAFVIFAVKE